MILVVDIGTSSVKAGLFRREDARPVWLHRQPLSGSGWVTEQWVRAICESMDRCPRLDELTAISMSGNGPTVVPVAPDGTAVADALLWLDDREQRVADQPSFFLPKLAWFKANAPREYESSWQLMTCPEYLVYLAGGEPHSTSPSAEFDPVVWNEAGIRAYDLDESKLPPLVRPGDSVGRTSSRAAEVFGIPPGVPIFAGGPDFLVSLLGTATVAPGRTCDRAGTSEGINFCDSEPTRAPGVRTLPHLVPGLWNVAGVLSSTGRIFEWFRRISRQTAVGYERMLQEIEATGFDEEPYFFPSVHRGAAWEFSRGMFAELRSTHGVAEMGRGVVHAIGYAVRQSIEALREAGCEVKLMRACGGQAKNATWVQMKADITGVAIEVPRVVDAELVGSVCCAVSGLGDYDTPWDAAESLVTMDRRFEPRERWHALFERGYHTYLDAYERILHSASL